MQALRESETLKTSLLRAISHDLTTPLTAITIHTEALRRKAESDPELQRAGRRHRRRDGAAASPHRQPAGHGPSRSGEGQAAPRADAARRSVPRRPREPAARLSVAAGHDPRRRRLPRRERRSVAGAGDPRQSDRERAPRVAAGRAAGAVARACIRSIRRRCASKCSTAGRACLPASPMRTGISSPARPATSRNAVSDWRSRAVWRRRTAAASASRRGRAAARSRGSMFRPRRCLAARRSRMTIAPLDSRRRRRSGDSRVAASASCAQRGYTTVSASDGLEGVRAFETHAPDLVLTDLSMPRSDGFELISAIRAKARTPIIVLSVRGDDADKIRALDLGADDFVTKPFSVAELLARVRAQLRRTAAAATTLAFDDLLDRSRAPPRDAGRPRHPPHADRVRAARAAGHECRQADLHRPHHRAASGATRRERRADTVRVHMSALRKKIEPDPSSPRYIVTEPWVGYRFIAEPVCEVRTAAAALCLLFIETISAFPRRSFGFLSDCAVFARCEWRSVISAGRCSIPDRFFWIAAAVLVAPSLTARSTHCRRPAAPSRPSVRSCVRGLFATRACVRARRASRTRSASASPGWCWPSSPRSRSRAASGTAGISLHRLAGPSAAAQHLLFVWVFAPALFAQREIEA